jgi:hypothetical protein
MVQSFPPLSVLAAVQSIKVNVEIQGEGIMSIMDKVLKQIVQGEIGNRGFEIVHGDRDCDAALFCRIGTVVSATDHRGRPAGYAFVVTYNLMQALPGQAEDELFVIWNDTYLGCGDHGSLYNQAASACRQLVYKLVARLEEDR